MTTTRLLQSYVWDVERAQSLPCSRDMGHTKCPLQQPKSNTALPSPQRRAPGSLPSQPCRSGTSTATEESTGSADRPHQLLAAIRGAPAGAYRDVG